MFGVLVQATGLQEELLGLDSEDLALGPLASHCSLTLFPHFQNANDDPFLPGPR